MKLTILAITLLLSFITNAQAGALDKKGKWSFYYGYNRAEYSNGDYHLTGNGYDFTLKDVRAHDVQSPLAVHPYLDLAFTVPQNNIRFSYFFTDTFSVSFGNDHMKYEMNRYQTVDFEGTITGTGTAYDNYSGNTIDITPDLLTFEHTDGLNFVSLEFEHFKPLWSNPKGTQAVSLFWGPGIALMYPKTNAKLFNNQRNDAFHISGTGYSIKAGVEYIFLTDYFARLAVKYGHINMDQARTTSSSSDNLSHEFDFRQLNLVFGVYF